MDGDKRTNTTDNDTTGILDEALQRLHTLGPEYNEGLSNHGPMAVEALVRHGQAASVHRWLDRYSTKLEELPEQVDPVTAANWSEALGDPRRVADWITYFEREIGEGRAWQEVLAEWWPRLLPGIAASSTHSVIRVGHAVRTLQSGDAGDDGPRLTELAYSLGYWAARHRLLPEVKSLAPVPDAAAALEAVEAIPEQRPGIWNRFAQLSAFPDWSAVATTDPDAARDALQELVTAAVHRYATHGHGEPVMLVHSATAPNAVLRTLPALPRELWPASLAAAWTAAAAVTAAYRPAEGVAYSPAGASLTADEIFEAAAAHGDDHAIKFTDTAVDVADTTALTAARRSVELIDPLW
ncbi:questin oxidase family protein [Streptomyces sp. E11-3]|uniref:questin oxidase family protein n=1 Tax=Streptomyces sp. E11-3 TaxID=3110112 RepID=UPI00397F423D